LHQTVYRRQQYFSLRTNLHQPTSNEPAEFQLLLKISVASEDSSFHRVTLIDTTLQKGYVMSYFAWDGAKE
jgi:hypothetical protein